MWCSGRLPEPDARRTRQRGGLLRLPDRAGPVPVPAGWRPCIRWWPRGDTCSLSMTSGTSNTGWRSRSAALGRARAHHAVPPGGRGVRWFGGEGRRATGGGRRGAAGPGGGGARSGRDRAAGRTGRRAAVGVDFDGTSPALGRRCSAAGTCAVVSGIGAGSRTVSAARGRRLASGAGGGQDLQADAAQDRLHGRVLGEQAQPDAGATSPRKTC